MERSTNPQNTTRAAIILSVVAAGLSTLALANPGCAHLDAGAQLGSAMAEHCAQPGLTEDERRECMEGFLDAALTCAAQHEPGEESTGTDTGDGTGGETE